MYKDKALGLWELAADCAPKCQKNITIIIDDSINITLVPGDRLKAVYMNFIKQRFSTGRQLGYTCCTYRNIF